MREYGRTEVIREKCHWCGCKNKLVTYLKDYSTGEEVGMLLRCCACGYVSTHLDPAQYDLIRKYVAKDLKVSRTKCVQESWCPHKGCPHYGTCRRHKEPPKSKVRRDHDSENRLIDRAKPLVKDFERHTKCKVGGRCKHGNRI